LRSDNGDEALFKALIQESFGVQVGIHELLGHGSGKMLYQNKDGSFNFDRETTIDPLTNAPVASFYKAGETWDSKFPGFGSSYEECRAELIGIYLCVHSNVLSIFGHEGDKAQDILYVNWLNMARAGLLALEFYRPATGSWGQVSICLGGMEHGGKVGLNRKRRIFFISLLARGCREGYTKNGIVTL